MSLFSKWYLLFPSICETLDCSSEVLPTQQPGEHGAGKEEWKPHLSCKPYFTILPLKFVCGYKEFIYRKMACDGYEAMLTSVKCLKTVLGELHTNTDPDSSWDKSQISYPGIKQSLHIFSCQHHEVFKDNTPP